jgi:hypothetical protein
MRLPRSSIEGLVDGPLLPQEAFRTTTTAF